MPKEFHERVDADVGVGQFGGVGVAQCVYERAGSALGIGAGEIEGAQDAVLQGPAGYSLAVLANKQWCAGRPAVQLIVARAAAGRAAAAVSIFLLLLGARMHRAPVSGEVIAVQRRPGRFGSTDLAAAGEDNETQQSADLECRRVRCCRRADRGPAGAAYRLRRARWRQAVDR